MVEKLKMQTKSIADENFEKLKAMFPNAITETIDYDGNIVRAIDKDVLMLEISAEVVEGRDERYQFNWPDKKKAIALANIPTSKTLRPCRDESVNFDNTQNLYIEGDNLEVLKILQETYLEKIKMIYIDPPYNTGNDFVYNDNFYMDRFEYLEDSGQFDEYGNRLEKNLESNGRYHTDWLNMFYPRLKLSRNLLSEDGVIFISIDDNEVHNLRKICDEIFGEENFVCEFTWQRAFSPKNDSKYVSKDHDFIICYARSLNNFTMGRLPRTEEANSRYKNLDNDPRGVWLSDNLTVKTYSAEYDYPIKTPGGKIVHPTSGRCWMMSQKRFKELVDDNRIWFGADGNNVPRLKRFLSELKFDGMSPTSILLHTEVGHSQEGRQEVKKLFDDRGYFDGPKPVRLLNHLLTLANLDKDSIVLDFFSGSATTAHSTIELNANDGGNRKFIMVQIPEETDEKSEAYKEGYKNICEIGKERIRRAGKKVIEENQDKEGIEHLDIGFRVLRVDSSNMKDVFYAPAKTEQSLLDMLSDNIKEDRSPEDLLFQVMLDLGVSLSSNIKQENIDSKDVFIIEDGFLIACFEKNITEETVKAIAEKTPYYAILRDSSMANDSVATNFEQIFENLSPQTIRRVI